jgi:hypothetical protein
VKTPAWLRDHRTVASALLLVTLLAYLPSVMGGTFHFDDGHSIVDNDGVRSLANIPRYFVEPQLWSAEPGNCMYRPALLVTFAVDYAVWGYRASGWLMTNVLIHACVVLLVYRIARRIGLSDLAAAFAGAVFALHPAISETQNYVSSRSESFAALLMLCALDLHLSARAADGGRRAAFVAGAALMSLAALLAKEMTACFCAVVAVLELTTSSGTFGRRFGRAAVFGALYAAPLGVFFLLRKHFLGMAVAPLAIVNAPAGADAQVGGGRSIVDGMLTQSRVMVLCLQTLVRPVQLNIDHDVAVSQRVTGAVAAAICVHVATIGAAVRSALRGHRLFPLCVGWFWAFSIVTFVIPLNVVMNEHRLYMPTIAVALLAGAALARVAELSAERFGSFEKGAALAAAPLVCFVPLLVQRAREWKDDETLWTTAVERAPLSGRAHMHLGAVWHERANAEYERDARVRLLDKALAEYATSDALHPGWADLHLDIGNARLARGKALHDKDDLEKALAAYVRFGEIVGVGTPRPRVLQAAALSELGEHDKALEMARQLKAEDSSVTTMYDDLVANILRKKGDKKGAAEAMERVIAIEEPLDRVDGLLQLGWWCFEDGELERAEPYLKRALAIARRSHDRRPPLYVIRFLTLVGQGASPTVGEMERMARALGWSAPPAEVRWVLGGATPGVFSGTAGRAAAPR